MDALKFKSAGLGTPCTVGDDVAGGFSITRGTDQFYDAETAISVSAADAIRLRDWLNAKYPAPPAAAHGDEAVRKDAEIAIKQGRYLASAAEDYINAIHDAFDLEETNLHREVVGDSNRRLSSAIYEFRRSAYRAMRAQGDGEAKA